MAVGVAATDVLGVGVIVGVGAGAGIDANSPSKTGRRFATNFHPFFDPLVPSTFNHVSIW